jgi:hypothetical protein
MLWTESGVTGVDQTRYLKTLEYTEYNTLEWMVEWTEIEVFTNKQTGSKVQGEQSAGAEVAVHKCQSQSYRLSTV